MTKTNLNEDFDVPGLRLRLFVFLPERRSGRVHRLQRRRVVKPGVRPHHDADDPRNRGGVHVRTAGAADKLAHVMAAGVWVGGELQ